CENSPFFMQIFSGFKHEFKWLPIQGRELVRPLIQMRDVASCRYLCFSIEQTILSGDVSPNGPLYKDKHQHLSVNVKNTVLF
ncbi:MAG: hypothetical protein JXX29_16100, partial [Deltaproteobacteria bacterium]|nr:hypothetical protein [Deltaproteobacteria bacterium]